MHLKKFSLIETDENSGAYIFSDAYDMLPFNTVNPADTEQTALTLNDKKRNLHRNDFLKFADSCGIERTVANRLIDRLISKRDIFETIVNSSFLTEELKEELRCLIFDRIEAIR